MKDLWLLCAFLLCALVMYAGVRWFDRVLKEVSRNLTTAGEEEGHEIRIVTENPIMLDCIEEALAGSRKSQLRVVSSSDEEACELVRSGAADLGMILQSKKELLDFGHEEWLLPFSGATQYWQDIPVENTHANEMVVLFWKNKALSREAERLVQQIKLQA
ncbi:MAG: hypothetical protein Q4B59_05385 [Lachnospiraceae bacterium]|nr:hypothetical protein [Lachnospiraceae bacterium]